MKKIDRFQVEAFLKKQRIHRHIRRAIALLSAFVLLFTMNTLKRNANTLSRYPMCGYDEHIHTVDCYDEEGNLICLIPEHVHTDACYQQAPDYVPEEVEQDLPMEDEFDEEEAAQDDFAEQELPAEQMLYKLQAPAKLSEIVAALGVDVDLDAVIEVGAVENDEAHMGLVSAEPVESEPKDWQISALRAFDDAELALITNDDIIIIPLVDGEPAPVEEEAPADEEPTEVGNNETESGNEGAEPTEVSTITGDEGADQTATDADAPATETPAEGEGENIADAEVDLSEVTEGDAEPTGDVIDNNAQEAAEGVENAEVENIEYGTEGVENAEVENIEYGTDGTENVEEANIEYGTEGAEPTDETEAAPTDDTHIEGEQAEEVEKAEGEDAEKAEGENAEKAEGEDAGKAEGEDAEKAEGENAEKAEGEDAEKAEGEDAEKAEGEDAEKAEGEDAEKAEGEDAEKAEGEDAEKAEGEDIEKAEGEEGEEAEDAEKAESEEGEETEEGEGAEATDETAEGGEAQAETAAPDISVTVDLSSVDLMSAASIEADTVKLSVADLLTGADDAIEVDGELTVDAETFADNADVASAENVEVESGMITLSAEALESGVVILELTTETMPEPGTQTEGEAEAQPEPAAEGEGEGEIEGETEGEALPEPAAEPAPIVTTQKVEIHLTGYTGRTTEEINSDPTVTIVPAEGNSLPADAFANVKEVEAPAELKEQEEPQENLVQDAVAYDITITNDNDDEISETGEVAVTLSTPDLNVLESIPEGMAPGEIALELYHVHDDGTTELVEDAEFETDDAGNVLSVSFSADSFSTYVVKYTVDFHYVVNGQIFEFAIAGGGYVSFEALAEALQLAQGEAAEFGEMNLGGEGEAVDVNGIEISEQTKRFVANVESLEFSSPNLVWVGKADEGTTVGGLKAANGLEIEYTAEMTEEKIAELDATPVSAGDWALISLLPFDTEETLTVTMVNGDQFTVNVTDGQLHSYVISDAGDLYEVIVTYDDTAEIPSDAELSVSQITADTEHYAENVEKVNQELIARSEGEVTDPVQFSISIVSNGEVVEPKPGSVVSVEVRLAQAMFQKPEAEEEEAEEGAEETDEADEEQKPSIMINGAEFTVDPDEGEIDFTNCKVVHIADDGTVEVIGEAQNTVEDDQLIVQFETESFSDYMFQSSNNNDAVLNDLPGTLYVGDEIYMWHLDEYWVTEIGNIVTETKFDANHDGNGDYKVVRAIAPGTFRISHRDHWHNGQTGTNYEGKYFTVKAASERPYEGPSGVLTEADGIVNNADIGLTLNLFDYDLDGYLDNRFNNLDYGVDDQKAVVDAFFAEHGINNGHNLKFWGSGIGGNYGAQNQYVEHGVTSIVENQLVDGYPKLTSANGGDRLDYLFTPSNGTDKKVYLNADKLFRRDANGYYIYDSNTNYAYYDPNQGNNGNFVVYTSEYKQKFFTNDDGSKNQINGELGPVTNKAIGFFPFHPWNSKYDLFTNWNKNLNHHFGLSMSVKFALPPAPKAVEDSNGNDIIFEFSGDDDLWVFIDGKLAMDIGGVHQPTSGTINFTTQEVWVNGNRQTGYDFSSLYDGNEHELKVFYIERGGSDSNCKIMFNITQYGDAGFVKKNQINQPLPSALFGLYKDAACTQPLMEHLDAAHNNIWRQFTAESNQRGLVEFHGIPVGTYYMREIQAPDDYPLDPTVHTIKVVAVGHSVQTRVYIDDMTTPVEKGQYGVWGKDIINYPTKYISLDLQKEWKDSTGTNLIDDTAGLTATFELKRTATYEKWTLGANNSYTVQTGTVTNDNFDYFALNPSDTDVVNNRITLSDSNNWQHTFGRLPLNVIDTNDTSITYHYKYWLEEVNVPSGMAVSYRYLNASGDPIEGPVEVNATEIATNKLPTVDIEATKTWKSSVTGQSVNATLKNATVTFELQRRTRTNGNWSGWEKVTKNAIGGAIDNPVTVSVAEANAAAWKVTWTKLLKSDDIEYQVIETYAMAGDDELVTDATAEKPQATVSFVSGTGTANIDNTLPTKPVTVQKTWSGSDTWYDSHLQVEVTLHATLNGTNCDATALAGRNDQIVMLTSSQPSYTWADLPVYSDAGDEIEYTVEETALYYKPDDGDAIYLGAAALDAFTTTSTVDANGDITIDNTPKTTEIDVEKEWVGDGNKSQVELYLVRYKKTFTAPAPTSAPTPIVTTRTVPVSITWNSAPTTDQVTVTATPVGGGAALTTTISGSGTSWSGSIADMVDDTEYTLAFSTNVANEAVIADNITVNSGSSIAATGTVTPIVVTRTVPVSITWNSAPTTDQVTVTATPVGGGNTLTATISGSGTSWSGTIANMVEGTEYTLAFETNVANEAVIADNITVNSGNSIAATGTVTPTIETKDVRVNLQYDDSNGTVPGDWFIWLQLVPADGRARINIETMWPGRETYTNEDQEWGSGCTLGFGFGGDNSDLVQGTVSGPTINGDLAEFTVTVSKKPTTQDRDVSVKAYRFQPNVSTNVTKDVDTTFKAGTTIRIQYHSQDLKTNLYINGEKVKAFTGAKDHKWEYTIPQDSEGVEIRVSDDWYPNGVTSQITVTAVSPSASASLFQMALDPFVAHADDYNAYGNATSVATVAGGITPPTGYTLDADWGKIIVLNNSGWSKQVENLPVYDEYGQEYYYAIVEREVPTGFTVTYNPGGTEPTPIAASSYTGTVATLKAINTFIGTYDHPTVTKYLNGKLFEGKLDDGTTVTERFTFNLYDSAGTLLQSVQTNADGTVHDFEDIEFLTAGEYVFSITETVVANSSLFNYDDQTIYWKVTIEPITGGQLISNPLHGGYYSDAACTQPLSAAIFDNTEKTYLDIYKMWELNGASAVYVYPDDDTAPTINVHLYRKPGVDGGAFVEIDSRTNKPVASGATASMYTLELDGNNYLTRHVSGLDKYYKKNGSWAEYEYYIVEDTTGEMHNWNPVMYMAGESPDPTATWPKQGVDQSVKGGGTITVVNSKFNVRLPSTGGMGTTVVYVAGSLLLVLAVLGWVLSAKKRNS